MQGATFHIEHIIPRSRGGETVSDNLALACNLHKSNHVEVPDPDSTGIVRLFHPRSDAWSRHFTWNGYRVIGETQVGRATTSALQLNSERRLRIREVEERFGYFPPEVSAQID